ncbi:hypothetical protein [Amycolatopsis anabasis]|uniref:hypothetical protein n=1 Tax=Amycolatopsis anabasis TaxID=1840409 RepID=UPI00131BF75E|nr:hypothetical protein [Amycolatopsis anabasis]
MSFRREAGRSNAPSRRRALGFPAGAAVGLGVLELGLPGGLYLRDERLRTLLKWQA